MKLLDHLESKAKILFDNNCFTNVYGTGRSLLAIGTLVTLLFSSPKILFDEALFYVRKEGAFFDNLNIFYQLGYENVTLTYLICIAVLLLVASGFYPRLTGIPHWIVAFSFNNATALPDGGDQVAMVLVLFLIPVTLLDNRRNHFYRKVKQNYFQKSVSVAILRFIIPLQMAVIYFHAAVDKLYKVEEWRNGTALYYILDDPLFGSSIFDGSLNFILTNEFTMVAMTWGTIFLEIVLFGAFFMAYRKRKYLLAAGLGFHFMIIVFFGLVSFFFSMAGGLIIYLLDPANHIDFKHIFARLKLPDRILKIKNEPSVT